MMATAVTACKGDFSVPDTLIATEMATYSVDPEGGVLDLSFYANMPWEIVITPANDNSNADGVVATPSSGEGSAKIQSAKLTFPANTGTKRDVLVTILAKAGETAVKITQKGLADPTETYGTIDLPYPPTMLRDQMMAGDVPSSAVYVRGIVSKVKEISTDYGNATFWLTEDGTHPDNDTDAFQVYRTKDYGGAGIENAELLGLGDVVTVYSTVTVYNGTTAETAQNQGQIIAVNGIGTAYGDGTEASPGNVGKAMALLAEGASDEVVITGVISKIAEVSTSYGNATYWITDDGWHPADDKAALQVFRGKWIGGEAFTAEDQIKVGDVVVLKGSLVKYNDTTPEVNTGSQIISVNGNTE